MCGIAGYWGTAFEAGAGEAALRRMTDALHHRGPDDQGAWLDAGAGVALGHRRLSILDLSPAGHQPMASPAGRFVVVFNGEIYNWQSLRAEEERHGARWRGHSDTEVMLAMFERLGLLEATRRLAGQFAFACWDREERTLTLGRDRLGEKPLYYGRMGSTFLFGSELKGLRAHPAWRGTIDRDALALYCRYNYVPAPYSIYVGVRKVEPGTLATFRGQGDPVVTPYWSLRDTVARGASDPLTGSDAELLDLLDQQLRATISEEMLADVPLGAFLSGGIDSSLIVALMQAQSPRPVRTFTIGFHEEAYDEADHARAVARHLGTDHTELYVAPEQALAVIPRLPAIYDEPFADVSQIPTFLVSELARRHVTVSLSGDGGDEMFGGYTRYFLGPRIWRWLAPVPTWLRRSMGRGMRAIPHATWDSALGRVGRFLPRRERFAHPGDQIHKLATVLAVPSAGAMYRHLMSNWNPPSEVLREGSERDGLLLAQADAPRPVGSVEWMMYVDAGTYLPDDILVKVDRAAMAVSLEARAPFLDHRVVELAWRLPLRLKLRERQGKWALRQLLDRYVPRHLVDRPKMGFGVPVDAWLRGPLKAWADDLLAPERLTREGFFDPAPVRRMWEEHQGGRLNRNLPLWNTLMFQAWLAAQTA